MIDEGLADFDTDAVMSRKRAIQAQREAAARRTGRATVYHPADYTATVVSLNLIDYKAARRAGGWRGPVEKHIRWVGLDNDTRSFRNIEPIRSLAVAVSELARLTERTDLRRPQ